MGTRGLKVYRLRKRYYAIYNNYDSYPSGLGKTIVDEIPLEPAEYQAWLAKVRAMVAEWEVEYESFITILPGNKVNTPGDAKKDSKADTQGQKEGEEEGENDEETPEPEYLQHQFPSFFMPVNDTYAEWIYTIDLDNEKFTVSNGAHFALEKMPHIQWMSALKTSSSRSQIVLPGIVPEEAVTDLVASPEEGGPAEELTQEVEHLKVEELVTPKGIGDVPWKIRHGALIRSSWFFFWSLGKKYPIESTLLQLVPSDLLFRELAYALVCLAAGGKHITVLKKNLMAQNSAFGIIKRNSNGDYDESSEFFTVLGSGAHREGEHAGSVPVEITYWFEDVLVVLVAQLYRKGAVEQGIDKVTKICQAEHGEKVTNAILLSIEHIVLVHFIPATNGSGVEIQHTALMPLFEIEEHLPIHTKDRYSSQYLSDLAAPSEKFQKRQDRKRRKAIQERMLLEEGINMQFGSDQDQVSDDEEEEEELLRSTQVKGYHLASFHALQHLFSAAARRLLRPSQQGRFPTEIYEKILSFLTDNATRDACLHTSHVLREICLKEYLVCEKDGLIIRPSESLEGCVDADHTPKWYNLFDMTTGEEQVVDVKRGACSFLDFPSEDDRMVLVGDGYGKKCLLPEAIFKFPEYKD